MTPQELKNSILLRAVNGELLEQNPTDEPAISFIDPIRTEQQRLLNAKLIKKEKFDPSISYTDELPDGWCYVKLGELTTVVTKQTGFDYSQYIKPNLVEVHLDGTIPMVQTKNFKGKSFNLNTDYYIPLSIAQQFPKILLDSKSMLLSIVGASIGNVGIYDDPSLAMIGGAICKVNLIDDRLYEYLFYYLQSPLGQQEIKKNYKATAQGTITVQDVREIVIKMPPLAEQRCIVAKLEEILPLIDRYEAAWNKLEEFNKRFPGDMQKSILQLAIQGKLVEQRSDEGTGEELFQQIQAEKQALIKAGKIKKEKPLPEISDDEIPFDIPDSWKWVRLRELGFFSSGKTPTMGEAKYWANGTVPWITSKDMKKKYLDWSEMQITKEAAQEMRMYQPNTILMVVRSGILKRLLPVAILTGESTINQDIKAFSLHLPEMAEYVYYILKGMETYILKEYRKQVTTVDSLRFEEFQNMPVPIPPRAEQKRIVAKLEEILPLCDRLK